MLRAALLAIGLLLCLTARPALAEDWAPCGAAGYLAHFDSRLTATEPCDVIATFDMRWTGGGAHLRAIKPHSTAITDNPAFIARMRETAEAISRAMDRMGPGLQLEDVVVLYTNYVSPARPATGSDEGFNKGDYTAHAATTFAHECPVAFFKERERRTGTEVSFALAHEVFHCVQYRTWPLLPGSNWLVEASAEYFAYLARPDRGANWIAEFDSTINARRLDAMSYEAVAFYLWLGDTSGPQSVRDFLTAKVTSPAIETAITQEQWSAFAQAYIDRRIHMPDGRPMPSNPRSLGTTAIHGTGIFGNSAVVPFTINSFTFAFDRGKFYDMVYSPPPPAGTVYWRMEASAAWAPPLTSISTCDGPQRYLVTVASVRAIPASQFEVNAQAAGASTCTCPAGVWQETRHSKQHYFEQPPFGDLSTPPRFISGDRVLTLNPDHTGSLIYNHIRTIFGGGTETTVEHDRSGGSHFTWRAANGLLWQTNVQPPRLTVHTTVTTSRGVEQRTLPFGIVQNIGMEFNCDEAGQQLHLRIHGVPPGFRLPLSTDMDFVRVGGHPAYEPEP